MDKKEWKSYKDLSFFRWFPGIPFILMGLFAICSPIICPIPMAGSGEPTPPLVIVTFGLLSTIVGALIFGWRQETGINLIQGTVSKWWGIFRPWRTSVYYIKDFDKITIRREVSGDSEGKTRVFPVALEGNEQVVLELSGDTLSARKLAKDIALLLRLDIYDHCSRDVVIREYATLGKQFIQRLDITDRTTELKPPPARSNCTVHRKGNTVHINIPSIGISWQMMIPVGALVFILIIAWMIFRPEPPAPDDPPGWQEIMVWGSRGILVLAAVFGFRFLIAPALQDGFRCEHLAISPEGILFTRRFIFRSCKEIDINDVDELIVEHQAVKRLHQLSMDVYRLSIRSDADEMIVAAGHPKEELHWLETMLKTLMSQ